MCTLMIIAALLSLLTVTGCSEGTEPDSVVAVVSGAERQPETDGHRCEIERALREALKMSPDELKNRGHTNYEMNPDA